MKDELLFYERKKERKYCPSPSFELTLKASSLAYQQSAYLIIVPRPTALIINAIPLRYPSQTS